jgi:hypothetical protein
MRAAASRASESRFATVESEMPQLRAKITEQQRQRVARRVLCLSKVELKNNGVTTARSSKDAIQQPQS